MVVSEAYFGNGLLLYACSNVHLYYTVCNQVLCNMLLLMIKTCSMLTALLLILGIGLKLTDVELVTTEAGSVEGWFIINIITGTSE